MPSKEIELDKSLKNNKIATGACGRKKSSPTEDNKKFFKSFIK